MKKLSLLLFAVFAIGLFIIPAAQAADKDVQFLWDYPVSSIGDAEGFRLYMKAPADADYPSTPFMFILTADACDVAAGTCCMIATIDDSVEHQFALKAYNATTESDYSNQVMFTPGMAFLPVPNGLQLNISVSSCN